MVDQDRHIEQDLRKLGPFAFRSLSHESRLARHYIAWHEDRERHIFIDLFKEGLDEVSQKSVHYELLYASRFQAVSQPQLLRVLDVKKEPPPAYVVRLASEGPDLEQVLAEEGPWAPDRAARLIARLARSLDIAHANKVQHRAIHPGLIHLGKDGQLELNYMGIADPTSMMTADQCRNVLRYAAPELIDEELVLDRRADIFSLGMVMWHLIAGRPAYDASGDVLLAAQVKAADPILIEHLVPMLPEPYLEVFDQCLAPIPQDRFKSGNAFAEALDNAISLSPIVPAVLPSGMPDPKIVKQAAWRKKALASGALVLFLSAIASIAYFNLPINLSRVVDNTEENNEPPPAPPEELQPEEMPEQELAIVTPPKPEDDAPQVTGNPAVNGQELEKTQAEETLPETVDQASLENNDDIPEEPFEQPAIKLSGSEFKALSQEYACSWIDLFDPDSEDVRVKGFVKEAVDVLNIEREAQNLEGYGTSRLEVLGQDHPICPVLDQLREFADGRPDQAVSVPFSPEPVTLRSNELLSLRIRVPEKDPDQPDIEQWHVRSDYITNNGKVARLFPSGLDSAPVSAGDTVRIGNPQEGEWFRIEGPKGLDLVLVLLSEEPFPETIARNMSAEDYLSWLQESKDALGNSTVYASLLSIHIDDQTGSVSESDPE